MSHVTPSPLTWLWEKRIPDGALSILQGYPNAGKSSLTIDLAARISRGDVMPHDPQPATGIGRPVLFIAPEDSITSVFRDRLERAGADLDLIHALATEEVDELRYCSGQLLAHIESIRPALVVVDPITAIIGTASEKQIRTALSPWVHAAEQYRTAILLVRHFQKDVRGDLSTFGVGSYALSAIVRSVLSLVRTSDSSEQAILSVMKCNLTRAPTDLLLGIHDTIEWLGESPVKAVDIIGNPKRPRLEEAKNTLIQLLYNGEMSVQDIKKTLKKHDIAMGTLKRAKIEMRIESRRKGFGTSSQVVWRLPETDAIELLRAQYKARLLDQLVDDLPNPNLNHKGKQPIGPG
jgi:KaiC/GvpD/RAD55 family RecA-like ATPase